MIIKKVLVLTVLALTVSAAGSLSARAQKAGADFAQPSKLSLEGLIKRRFPEFYGKAFPQEQLITEEFYPIGWSKDGKFAYYSEPGDEACGCYFAKLRILDLVSDKVLWSFDYNGFDHQEEDQKNAPKAINDLWRANRKLFSDKLREHGITPQGRFALLLFPISRGGDRLSADLKIKENKEEDGAAYGIVGQATLNLASRRNGKKIVFDHNYLKGSNAVLPLAMKVLGYVKSPFEERVAVVMIEIYRGYEGPPNTAHITIAGASLASGFK